MSRPALEATVRRRVAWLVRAYADPSGSRPKDRELAMQLKLLRSLDPRFDARVRALAGLDRPARPAPTKQARATNPATATKQARVWPATGTVRIAHATSPIIRQATTPLFNVSDIGGYYRNPGA